MKRLLLLLCLLGTGANAEPADVFDKPMEERITSGMSTSDVSITATFTGSNILVFGGIERNRFFRRGADTLPDVIIAIRGPTSPLLVRRKERVAGIWTNNASVEIKSAPAYYAVASTRPIEQILSLFEQRIARIPIDKTVYFGETPFTSTNPESFRQAVIRIRTGQGLYHEAPHGVKLLGPSLFKAEFELPYNIVEGFYTTRVLLVRDGAIIDERDTTITVRKDRFGQRVNGFSVSNPLLYGMLSVLIALFAGWSASAVFQRLRRR